MSYVNAIGRGSMMLLKSRTFWIIVILIILAIIIWRYSDRAIEKAESRLGRQYGDWQEGTISEGRKKELENLAQELYNAIYGWELNPSGDHRVPSFTKANALNDNELLYVARYYENAITKGNSLYYDIDEEWMYLETIDESLMARLSKLGMK